MFRSIGSSTLRAFAVAHILVSSRQQSMPPPPGQEGFSAEQQGEEVDAAGVRKQPFGSSKEGEDAFGHTDAFAAIRQSIHESKAAKDSSSQEEDVDEAASNVNRRRNKRKKTMDNILGDILEDALRMRDAGKKPDMDFIYKQTQERVYEAEHGQKPPSQKERNAKYIPFPPDFHLHRLQEANLDDPWPERAITSENPVLNTNEAERDKQKNGGKLLKAQEMMFQPREGRDPVDEFSDAVDELSHWELQFVDFVRNVPVEQRRTLPLLHEYYRLFTHRLMRAERRFIVTRDYALSLSKASSDAFKRSEDRVERVRNFYAATHKSLSSPNYDPVKMRQRDIIGKLIAMNPTEFEEWKAAELEAKNLLIADFRPSE
ncbi:Hypothetical protein, putative [Bodo saltans]|uniref:Uncharacterized protein n=1 Tax=Bodo saltans TaxID=75058 RepID=A0A0S4JDE7_BODSA|nr:Hypothetical protein, putative [Bodo saltans]|eukprot:CUG88072.1 Hypothetical protein, putative [Bodo saltans]